MPIRPGRPSMVAMASRAPEPRTGRPWGNHARVDPEPQEPPTGKKPGPGGSRHFGTNTQLNHADLAQLEEQPSGKAVGWGFEALVPCEVPLNPARGTQWKRGSLSQGPRRGGTDNSTAGTFAVRCGKPADATSDPTPPSAQDQPWGKRPMTTEIGSRGNNNTNRLMSRWNSGETARPTRGAVAVAMRGPRVGQRSVRLWWTMAVQPSRKRHAHGSIPCGGSLHP